MIMEKIKEIELYIKQSRDELEGAVWDGDPLMIFYMLEELQAENKRLKEGIELYMILKERQQFTPIETMRKIEKYLNKKVIGKGYLISSLVREMKQALKDATDGKEES